MLWRPPKYY